MRRKIARHAHLLKQGRRRLRTTGKVCLPLAFEGDVTQIKNLRDTMHLRCFGTPRKSTH
jgi:hypothetical protein